MSKGGFAAQVPSYTQNELGNQLAIRCINPRTQEGTCLWPNLLVHPASEHGVLSERHWPKVGEEQLGAEPSPQRLKAAHCGGGGYVSHASATDRQEFLKQATCSTLE